MSRVFAAFLEKSVEFLIGTGMSIQGQCLLRASLDPETQLLIRDKLLELTISQLVEHFGLEVLRPGFQLGSA